MKELIFNIGNIFDAGSQECCLVQYDCKMYHIPAYQRGYKWGSDADGAVSILLNDLWDAYENKSKTTREYYLQYITVKKNLIEVNSCPITCLEVIDGQQRLTTLSILLSVLSSKLGEDNISDSKLHYAIRENFFTKYIYDQDGLSWLFKTSWDEISQDKDLDKQDLFYIASAAKKIHTFFKAKESELKGFYRYLLSQVKIIVNSVEQHIESETVFKNLNSNKVALTEPELIKGLLITKIGRSQNSHRQPSFAEITERRVSLARHWDEISHWATRPDIEAYFFNGKYGMGELLQLVAKVFGRELRISYSSDTNKFPIFNAFNRYENINKIYQILRETQAVLNDWFENDEVYNLMGYCRFARKSGNNTLNFLADGLGKDKDELKKWLNAKRLDLLPDAGAQLYFDEKDDKDKIHAVLLALSVFPEGTTARFNFYELIERKWSLEHIFPQSPEGGKAVLNATQKAAVKEMLGKHLTQKISKLLDKPTRDAEQKQQYYEALQELSELNSMGNICLLSSGDNSSNGCMFFDEKRANVLKLIQKGSFVPKHTFDVFSKMIPGLSSSDLSVWSDNDITSHTTFIQNAIKSFHP